MEQRKNQYRTVQRYNMKQKKDPMCDKIQLSFFTPHYKKESRGHNHLPSAVSPRWGKSQKTKTHMHPSTRPTQQKLGTNSPS